MWQQIILVLADAMRGTELCALLPSDMIRIASVLQLQGRDHKPELPEICMAKYLANLRYLRIMKKVKGATGEKGRCSGLGRERMDKQHTEMTGHKTRCRGRNNKKLFQALISKITLGTQGN